MALNVSRSAAAARKKKNSQNSTVRQPVYTGAQTQVVQPAGSTTLTGTNVKNSAAPAGGDKYASSGIYGVANVGKPAGTTQFKGGGSGSLAVANMARNKDMIGTGGYATSGGRTVFYDDQGYATKSVKGVLDYTPHKDLNAKDGTYNAQGAWTDNEMLTAADLQRIAAIRADGSLTGQQKNDAANAIRAGYGYSIDQSGYVTDLIAKSNVDARRQQYGLPIATTPEQLSTLTAMFPEARTTDLNALLGSMRELSNGTYAPMQPYRPSAGTGRTVASQSKTYGDLGDFGGMPYGGSYGYSPAPTYQGSQWDGVLNQLANELIGMNYEDWTQGDQYAALANRFGEQGRMSMQDVLGQISARTGGLASSYATSAGQQQYNSYMARLEEAAREMYDADRADLLGDAQMAQGFAQEDYNQYLDTLGQWNTDRNFAYNAYRDSVADQQYADQLAYDRQQDALALQMQQEALAQDQALARAELLASAGDYSGYAALGYSDSDIALLTAAAQAAQQSAGKSRSSGSGSGGGYSEGDYDALFAAASQKVSPKNYISSNYKNYGFSSSSNLGSAYDTYIENGGASPVMDFTEDEGIFTLNGQQYSRFQDLADAINGMTLTPGQKEELARKMARYGFDLSF